MTPPCKNSVATGFPAPLADFIDVDSRGCPSFSYPAQVGRLLGEISHIDRLMTQALNLRGLNRVHALRNVADEIRMCRKKHDTITAQWNEVLEKRTAARAAAGG
jgi:hypothetical protein